MFENKEIFIKSFLDFIVEKYGKEFEDTNNFERYKVLVSMITTEGGVLGHDTNKRYQAEDCRRVYYFSMEFLIGRLLYNYLLNLGILSIVQEGLNDLGVDLDDLIAEERDPGLGNGGLGRLAACYLDSMAYQDIPGYGYGLFYRYGLFKQDIVNGYQIELPDDWLDNGCPWVGRHYEKAVVVRFGGNVVSHTVEGERTTYIWEAAQEVLAVPNVIQIIGFGGKTTNRLTLWSAQPVVDKLDLEAFNCGDYCGAFRCRAEIEAITQLLYPSDSHNTGKVLRLKQEYFLVAAGLADIIRHYREDHGEDNWDQFAKRIAVHINDTHPAMCGPELMRIFMDDLGMPWEAAWDLVTQVISFTNHTILPESLEQWPISMFREVLPRIYMIIEEIDRRYRESLPHDLNNWQDVLANTAILWDGKVRMANLSVVISYSVNGVSALHTEILAQDVLHSYYLLTPQKFNNKTNGVSHRRFLAEANPALSELITEAIGPGWLGDASLLKGLKAFESDTAFLDKLAQVKQCNKRRLASYIWKNCNVRIDPNSLFDIQVKRFHGYKRQHMNVLKIMDLYNRLLENPNLDLQPTTFIFSGKAAQDYSFAKLVIKLINSLADIINHDQRLNNRIKVVFLKNFNVSLAQLIYPAADISEQISTAGMEASGTGNMKFMMNGAITLGTLDGANIEILHEVGDDNIKIFGLTAEEILSFRDSHTYNAWDVYNSNPRIHHVVDQLKNGFLSAGGADYWELQDSLLRNNDYFFVLKDLISYIDAWQDLNGQFNLPMLWQKTSLRNIASSGYFSSDRAIAEYAKEIWKIRNV